MERYCYLKDDCSLFEGKKDNGLWELNYRRLVESALKNKKKQDEKILKIVKKIILFKQ